MRITFIVTKLNFNGGGENHDVIMKIRALQEKGHVITVVTVFSKLNNIPKGVSFRVIEEQPPSNKLIGLQIFIVGIFKKYASQTDIFYLIGSSFVFGGGWYRLAAKTSKPVVADLNGYADYVEGYYKKAPLYPADRLPWERSWRSKLKHQIRIWLERWLGVYLINRLDAIIFMTGTIAQYYFRVGVKKDKATIVPSFQDIKAWQAKLLESNPFPESSEKTFNILCLDRFHLDKGIDLLIKAFERCHSIDAKLHLVGNGPEFDNLIFLIKKKKLGEKVKFYPWQTADQLVAFYQHADLFVHPARLPEPLARTTIEAMSFGCPLVVSSTSSEDWVAKEVAKTFVLGDVTDLTNKIIAAYNDKSFLQSARVRGKIRAEELDYRRHINQLNNVLELVKARVLK